MEKEAWETKIVDGEKTKTWGVRMKLVPVSGSVVPEQGLHDEESTRVGQLRLVSYIE